MNRDAYDITVIHPIMKAGVAALTADMATRRFKIEDGRQFFLAPFEGFRHPLRQYHLLTRTKSTKAGPWQSAHQYGLAVDFAGRVIHEDGIIPPNSWNWDEVPEIAWKELARRASVHGLAVPIAWDKGHVQHPLFAKIRAILG